MPNWTFNTITIRGSREELDRLYNDGMNNRKPDYKGEMRLFLSSWIPTPQTFLEYDTTNYPNGEHMKIGEEFRPGLQGAKYEGEIITAEMIEDYKRATKEQKDKYGVVGWYDYNLRTFGCKWDSDIYEMSKVNEDGIEYAIEITCDTPWTAPEMFLLTLSKKYEVVIELRAEYEDGYWLETEYEDGGVSYSEEGEMEYEDEEECEEE